jgi:thiol-disulfide isomerase/thioredoxin
MSEDRELEEIKQRMLERMMSPPSKPDILRGGVVNVLTDVNFDQAVSGATLPLLVDFWVDWCMPCKSMAPVVEAMARDRDCSGLTSTSSQRPSGLHQRKDPTLESSESATS